MAMAGCEKCASVVRVAGLADAPIGGVWRACAECGEPMHWVEPTHAAALVRRRHEEDRARRGLALAATATAHETDGTVSHA
jgi:hypothetical protein